MLGKFDGLIWAATIVVIVLGVMIVTCEFFELLVPLIVWYIFFMHYCAEQD